MSEASRNLPNVGWKGRIKQILILLGAILLGVIISNTVRAQDFQKAQKRHFKAKYKTQISTSQQECAILIKKRNAPHKAPHNQKATLFASHTRKPKYKPQAEVDAPRFAMINQ